jgi:hypothetical protein
MKSPVQRLCLAALMCLMSAILVIRLAAPPERIQSKTVHGPSNRQCDQISSQSLRQEYEAENLEGFLQSGPQIFALRLGSLAES